MYKQAREGKIKNFTGIDDPYEPPLNPELVIDTVNASAEENADRIIAYLAAGGFLLTGQSDLETLNGVEEANELANVMRS
jgi:hypothetical protein